VDRHKCLCQKITYDVVYSSWQAVQYIHTYMHAYNAKEKVSKKTYAKNGNDNY